MYSLLYSLSKKPMLCFVLLFMAGFYANAQQVSTAATPKRPVSVIYASQLSKSSPMIKEYIKAHPEEFSIQADPQPAPPAPFHKPLVNTKSVSCVPGAGIENNNKPNTSPPSSKIKISKATFESMPTEKQVEIMKHSEYYEFTE